MASDIKNKNVIRRPIEEILNSSFGKYAKYIIQDRALPDIRDGLKPVQRRILFAMYNLGITHDKAYKKSARTVGEVIGKYHPHGDSSIYEAMVRMSQEWKNNIPLLDMHGNKGSIDGDSAAAMRYTECRLAKISEYMLENIEKKTVTFIPNFDDSEKEPSFLPSMIPNLLFNGATGIAAGYATNIPPFNPAEVINAIIHRIDNPNCTIASLAKHMPGPDYPTGGIIQGKSGIMEAYETGKGKHVIRAEIEEKEVSKKLKQLIIKSIPYETNKSTIIKSIDDLIYNEKISGIQEVRDESDKNGVNIVIDIDPDKSFEVIKNFLYKNTQLQISYAINFIAIHNRKPVLMSLANAIDAYIEHSIDVLVKTLNYDLAKSLRRLEVLEGLIKAMSILDDVIRIIRRSESKDDSKKNLMAKFRFSEIQAEAIVTLRLYKLSNTDVTLVKKEHGELQLIIQEIKSILASDELQRNTIKKILRNYKSEFAYDRKTQIEDEIEKIVINDADLQESKDVVVMITKDGYLKTTTKRSIDSSIYNDVTLKSGDIIIDMYESNTTNQVIVITSLGQYISIPCHKIKQLKYKDAAEHINNLIKLDSDEKVVCSFQTNAILGVNEQILICTEQGQIKRVDLSDLTLSKSVKSSSIMNLKNDDKVVSCQLIPKDIDGDVVCITKCGLCIRFKISEVPIVGRTASGVKAQKLAEKDRIIACVYSPRPDKHQIVVGATKGLKRIHFNDIPLTKRAGIGRNIMLQVKSDPYVLVQACTCNSRDKINILTDDGITTIQASDINLTNLETRFSSYNKKIITFYRDNWISSNINEFDATTSLNVDDNNEGDVQGGIF